MPVNEGGLKNINKIRWLGLDVGSESIKFVILEEHGGNIKWTHSLVVDHKKVPIDTLREILSSYSADDFAGGAVTGRVAEILNLPKIPEPRAMVEGFLFFHPDALPASLVDIGAHGFAVIEIRDRDRIIRRENSKCSQGTGNFLRQLTERFDLDVEEADRLASEVDKPSHLAGRCPVILKTDMTHLANKGEPREQILAGLFDAVAENVEMLIKPGLTPPDVYLTGGVSRSERVQNHFESFLKERNMSLHRTPPDEFLFYGAIGAAMEARSQGMTMPEKFEFTVKKGEFEHMGRLDESMDLVRRLQPSPRPRNIEGRQVVLGFDIGSTGSKAVAIDISTREPVWDSYRRTEGDPVGAAKALVRSFLDDTKGTVKVVAASATGSGREIVGNMLISLYGKDRVFIINEIAAHAEGALFYDPEVDTIFEIGGQDAKYIRLQDGEIFDAAMNEACSAGTGSFIEEQGKRFAQVSDVKQMSHIALGAEYSISLGQHCSVFMAEVIDNALSAGEPPTAIIAGIYDSIIQNYLNRVKGNRSVGRKIFCQGMPFASDALAAAVARQTGRPIVIPPEPGLMGALGIALLAHKELGIEPDRDYETMDLNRFLETQVVSKSEFNCKSTVGCGGTGNKCRIDVLRLNIGGKTRSFLWGGACSLYDKGMGIRPKLPDGSPDPFRRRRELVSNLVESLSEKRGRPVVGVSEEFILKSQLPFFGTFLRELGFDLEIVSDQGYDTLSRGIEEQNVPMCAPMQMYTGVLHNLVDRDIDYLFLPMIRDLPRVTNEKYSTICPMTQGSADIFSQAVTRRHPDIKIIDPVIDMGPGNLESRLFIESMEALAARFGVEDRSVWWPAYLKALAAQKNFDAQVKRFGREALQFAEENGIVPVVVLGRPYTIYNDILNASVPQLLQEQGAMPIPVDAYPVPDDVPVYEIYWGWSQLNLRAAHEVRRHQGHYSIWCSNYSCGPDSFNLHFYSHIMEGKPFAIIETDGHAGNAGTKTRIEAFLYCVDTDIRSGYRSQQRERNQLKNVEYHEIQVVDVKQRQEKLLIPRMGEGPAVLAAVFRGDGIDAEALPVPDREALNHGRKYTSGKECLPIAVTLGSLLKRLEEARPEERFAFLMPTANGPCRFGMYQLFYKLMFHQLGLDSRVDLVSPSDSDYFQGLSKGLAIKIWVGIVASDLLYNALLHVRPVEREPGLANRIYQKWYARLQEVLESRPSPSLGGAMVEAVGSMFGVRDLISAAVRELHGAMDPSKDIPTVAMVGEIYVRMDPFSNDFMIDKLEKRGIRVRFAPVSEWIEYTDFTNAIEGSVGRFQDVPSPMERALTLFIQRSIYYQMWNEVSPLFGWGEPPAIREVLESARPYVRTELLGEAALTVGGPITEYRHGQVHGVVSVGPLECMPNKIAENQFFYIQEDLNLPYLFVSMEGDPIDVTPVDNFAYEVHKMYASMKAARQEDIRTAE